MPEKLGGYIGTGVVSTGVFSTGAGKPCQYILQTPATRAVSLLYNGLPTYSNND